jgi:prepilin-type N-terminal cleavage/methylation domain-containing protein
MIRIFASRLENMQPLSKKLNKGFTLIETLFAVLIFSAALVSLMTIAGRGITATASARSQITAHYLAQEGLEVVRNIRDTNFVLDAVWDGGFSQCTGQSSQQFQSPCQVNYGSNSAAATPTLGACTNNCAVFTANQAYVDAGFAGAVPSPYQRRVWVVPHTGQSNTTGVPDEYQVISQVIWTDRTISRRVELATVIKQWQ